MSSNDDKLLTKEEHLANYIKTFVAIEDAMEPFKEQRKDLRESYNENGWLSKDEMRQAVRAYRMLKKGDDINQFSDYYTQLNKKITGV